MWVYLNSGDSDLNLGWTNDAWKRGVYDANIHITKVALSKKPKVRKRKAFRRNAQNYCYERGRWFYDEKARTARTFWRNQTIGYCFYGLKPGTYEIQIRARNHGKTGLPPGYENFQVTVAADGVTGDAIIPAHETKFRKGKAILDLRGGNVTVNLTWLNDRYKKGPIRCEYRDSQRASQAHRRLQPHRSFGLFKQRRSGNRSGNHGFGCGCAARPGSVVCLSQKNGRAGRIIRKS